MTGNRSGGMLRIAVLLAPVIAWGGAAAGPRLPGAEEPKPQAKAGGRTLSHEETLRWIVEHRAWRLARKTKPIWARPVGPEEVGREFQTADHVKEVAREGAWLCVGSAGEPWFQSLEKIEGKYEPGEEASKRFAFDEGPHTYRQFRPKGSARNWAARVEGPGIDGFSIRPGYDPERPLYSPAGGFVVMEAVADPYRGTPDDVWLVQEPLFESTYEIIEDPDRETDGDGGPNRGPGR